VVHRKHQVIHRKLLSALFLFRLVVKIPEKSGEFDPLGGETLGVKFELARGTIHALEHFEEVKSVQIHSSEFALMYLSHIHSTVGESWNGLQNDSPFIGTPKIRHFG
jgi:hypothetical protein